MINPNEIRQFFESAGVAGVRAQVSSGGYNPEMTEIAVRWLADKEREAAERRDAALAEQMRLTRLTCFFAAVAAAAAIVQYFYTRDVLRIVKHLH